MANNIDFSVEWQGDEQKTALLILEHLIKNPTKAHLPVNVAITGPPGVGKSLDALKIQDELYKRDGIDFSQYLKDVLIMTPAHFKEKLSGMLNDKRLKEIYIVHLDESRFVVGSETWNSMINHAINHVRGASREIKPMAMFILTQSLKDIDKRTRDDLKFQFKVKRKVNGASRMYPYIFWIDDMNVERPILRRRRVQGIIKKDGETIRCFPTFIFNSIVRKEVREPYREIQVKEKLEVLNKLLENMDRKIKKELSNNTEDISEKVILSLQKDNDLLTTFTFLKGKKIKVRADFFEKLGLDKSLIPVIEKKLNEKKENDIIGEPKPVLEK
jgi:hypothetical protein